MVQVVGHYDVDNFDALVLDQVAVVLDDRDIGGILFRLLARSRRAIGDHHQLRGEAVPDGRSVTAPPGTVPDQPVSHRFDRHDDLVAGFRYGVQFVFICSLEKAFFMLRLGVRTTERGSERVGAAVQASGVAFQASRNSSSPMPV